MNNRLHHIPIQDWPKLAQKANWRVARLAKQQGVTLRSLQRFFKEEMGKSPKKWLTEQRLLQANEQVQRGSSVKETAGLLNYKHPSHLTNAFKRQWGCCPVEKAASIRAQSP